MKARANAVGELEEAGVFEDITQLGEGQSDIDRELAQLSQGSQVEDELAKMKAQLGSGAEAPALEQGQPAEAAPAEGAPAEAAPAEQGEKEESR
jgi:phage shock protein A